MRVPAQFHVLNLDLSSSYQLKLISLGLYPRHVVCKDSIELVVLW